VPPTISHTHRGWLFIVVCCRSLLRLEDTHALKWFALITAELLFFCITQIFSPAHSSLQSSSRPLHLRHQKVAEESRRIASCQSRQREKNGIQPGIEFVILSGRVDRFVVGSACYHHHLPLPRDIHHNLHYARTCFFISSPSRSIPSIVCLSIRLKYGIVRLEELLSLLSILSLAAASVLGRLERSPYHKARWIIK
jgi:hypothetical protein